MFTGNVFKHTETRDAVQILTQQDTRAKGCCQRVARKWEKSSYHLFLPWNSVNRYWLPLQIWIKYLRTIRWEQTSQVCFCTHQSPVNICTSYIDLQHKSSSVNVQKMKSNKSGSSITTIHKSQGSSIYQFKHV